MTAKIQKKKFLYHNYNPDVASENNYYHTIRYGRFHYKNDSVFENAQKLRKIAF